MGRIGDARRRYDSARKKSDRNAEEIVERQREAVADFLPHGRREADDATARTMRALAESADPMGPASVADAIGVSRQRGYQVLRRLTEGGIVERRGRGAYVLADESGWAETIIDSEPTVADQYQTAVEATLREAGGPLKVRELTARVAVPGARMDVPRVYEALTALRDAGEVRRVGHGLWVHAAHDEGQEKPPVRDRILAAVAEGARSPKEVHGKVPVSGIGFYLLRLVEEGLLRKPRRGQYKLTAAGKRAVA